MSDIVTGSTALAIENTALRARIAQLEAALRLIDSVSVHSGGDVHGVNPTQWEAALKEVQAMARAALGEERT